MVYTYRISRQVMPEGDRPEFTDRNQQTARAMYLAWYEGYRRRTEEGGHLSIRFRALPFRRAA